MQGKAGAPSWQLQVPLMQLWGLGGVHMVQWQLSAGKVLLGEAELALPTMLHNPRRTWTLPLHASPEARSTYAVPAELQVCTATAWCNAILLQLHL